MLNRGIRLSGESQEFFIHGRIESLASRLPADFAVRRVLDFGCGIGVAPQYLAAKFPGAAVVGVDTSEKALGYAREHYGSQPVGCFILAGLWQGGGFYLCFIDG